MPGEDALYLGSELQSSVACAVEVRLGVGDVIAVVAGIVADPEIIRVRQPFPAKHPHHPPTGQQLGGVEPQPREPAPPSRKLGVQRQDRPIGLGLDEILEPFRLHQPEISTEGQAVAGGEEHLRVEDVDPVILEEVVLLGDEGGRHEQDEPRQHASGHYPRSKRYAES